MDNSSFSDWSLEHVGEDVRARLGDWLWHHWVEGWLSLDRLVDWSVDHIWSNWGWSNVYWSNVDWSLVDHFSLADDLVGEWIFIVFEVLVDDVSLLVWVEEVDDLAVVVFEPGEGAAISDHLETRLLEDGAGWVGLTRVDLVSFAILLDLFDILSTVVSSESKSLVGHASVAAASPSGPVPFAAITHIAADSFVSKEIVSSTDAETRSNWTTVAVSSSGLLTKSAGDSASRPAGPGTEVRTGWCRASNSFDFIGLLAGAGPRSLSSFDWGSFVDVALG